MIPLGKKLNIFANIVDLDFLLFMITFLLLCKAETITQRCKIESISICTNNLIIGSFALLHWLSLKHKNKVAIAVLEQFLPLTHNNFANIIVIVEILRIGNSDKAK